jgi:hypothetical protein
MAIEEDFIQMAPALLYAKDREGRYVFVNDAFVESCRAQGLEVTRESIVGSSDRTLWAYAAHDYEENDVETWRHGFTSKTRYGVVERQPFFVTQFVFGEYLGGIALDIGQMASDLAESLGLNARLLQSLESSANMLKALKFMAPDS